MKCVIHPVVSHFEQWAPTVQKFGAMKYFGDRQNDCSSIYSISQAAKELIYFPFCYTRAVFLATNEFTGGKILISKMSFLSSLTAIGKLS